MLKHPTVERKVHWHALSDFPSEGVGECFLFMNHATPESTIISHLWRSSIPILYYGVLVYWGFMNPIEND